MRLAIWVMLFVLLVGFLLGSWEIECGRETDHHVSALVKHGRPACSARDLVGELGRGGRNRVNVTVGTACQLGPCLHLQCLPVEAEPVGVIVKSDLILLEDSCELER